MKILYISLLFLFLANCTKPDEPDSVCTQARFASSYDGEYRGKQKNKTGEARLIIKDTLFTYFLLHQGYTLDSISGIFTYNGNREVTWFYNPGKTMRYQVKESLGDSLILYRLIDTIWLVKNFPVSIEPKPERIGCHSNNVLAALIHPEGYGVQLILDRIKK